MFINSLLYLLWCLPDCSKLSVALFCDQLHHVPIKCLFQLVLSGGIVTTCIEFQNLIMGQRLENPKTPVPTSLQTRLLRLSLLKME